MKSLRALTFAILPLALVGGDRDVELRELEKPGVEKIAQLTAREHSTILFTLAERVVGYAREGHVRWIDPNNVPSRCGWPHPALSHNGLDVVFSSNGDRPGYCRIAVQHILTGVRREVTTVRDDPGEISWSWDDTEIVFFERGRGLSAVSVSNRARRSIPFPKVAPGRRDVHFWVWYPIQWLHNGTNVVLEVGTNVPTGQPETYSEQRNVLLLSGENYRLVAIGSQPSVSPLADRIAHYDASGRIVASDAEGSGRTVLGNAPRPMTALFSKEQLFGSIVSIC